MDWQDIAVRAGKTFLQAFIAVLIASEVGSVTDLTSLELWDQAAVAGLAAILSFAQNTLAALGDRSKDEG